MGVDHFGHFSNLEVQDLELRMKLDATTVRNLELTETLIDRALQVRKGNISRAAEDLGVSRPTLYELMSKLGIERP